MTLCIGACRKGFAIVEETYTLTIDVKMYLKYNLSIEINSTPLKNNMVEVNTKFIFSDPDNSEKKSYFEILYSTVIKLEQNIIDKKEIEKIILVDVQNEIYPNLEKTFLDTVRNSGYKNLNIEKKPDFEKLYLSRIS